MPVKRHNSQSSQLTDPNYQSNIQNKQANQLSSVSYRVDTHKDINALPEKVLIKIFSYLTHNEILKCALVCKLWRNISQNPKMWRTLKLRSDYVDSLHVKNIDYFMYLLNHRFNSALEYIELPIELITAPVLHDLANKCSILTHLTLDFSAAMQLQDFDVLNTFPCNLKMLTICLSEVIFLEGFMRKIYSHLSSLEQLHLIGTLESSNDPDEAYETINISKIKAYTPNLKIINLYGITFIEDNHIESIASGCIHLECVALNYCSRFKGYSLKALISKCKKIKSLLLQNTGIEDNAINAVDWDQTALQELDLSSTDLSEQALLDFLCHLPPLVYLSVSNCDGFTDKVLDSMNELNKFCRLSALDIGDTVNLASEAVFSFIRKYGNQLKGFSYPGNVKVTEQFWISSIQNMKNLRIVIMGTSYGWFKRISTRIHVDQIIESFAVNCPQLERLEIQWDPETIRFNENSRKFVDHIRLKCSKLKSLVLSDGEYYEMVKSNFERAERMKVVRTTTTFHTSIVSLLQNYNKLLFN